MTAPRLYSCWFDVRRGPGIKAWPLDWYRRHARVLEFSAKRNNPLWSVEVEQIGPDPGRAAARGGGFGSYSHNTHKLLRWNDVVQAAPDGDRLLLIDADTMVLRPLDAAWEQDFDVAYTTKHVSRMPLNAGVVFLRVGPSARAFMAAWLDWNMRLMGNAALHRRWANPYGGVNQAALGALLTDGGARLAKLHELRCEEWNSETETWNGYDPDDPPRIVHVKGAMRRGLMDPKQRSAAINNNFPHRERIADEWRAFEEQALRRVG